MIHHLSKRIVPATVLLFSIIIVFLSIPRLISSLNASYPDTVYKRLLYDGKPVDQSIIKARNSLGTAIEWNETAYYWIQNGHFLLEQALSGQYEWEERQRLIHQSRNAYKLCLTISPVEPYVWYRMAVITHLLDRTDQRITDMLKLSIYTGRVKPNLLKARVFFLYKYKGVLGDELTSMLQSQIRLLWQLRKKDLVEVVYKNPDIVPLVYKVLNNFPDDQLQFNQLLEKYTEKYNRAR